MIFHIANVADWVAAMAAGAYSARSLASEGFIHCCREVQLAGVADRYFRGATHLVLLRIDPGQLEAALVDEYSPAGQDAFPHIYGPINLAAVLDVTPFDPSAA